MIITILGCGGSGGVPLIGNQWGSCDPANPKNRRLRSSLLIEQDNATLLIDTSPDLRAQALAANIKHVSAVLYTHAHADHCHGIDDLRSINWMMKQPIQVYGDETTINKLATRFDYIFRHKPETENYFKPVLQEHVINGPLVFGPLHVTAFEQDHGYIKSLGFRINDFAYTTDAKALDENAFRVLAGIDTWIVDCVSRDPHPTHSHLAQTLEWIARVKPKRAYLTHLGHHMDYDQLCGELPEHIKPAYDGLKISINS